ncbi:hypothetical protein GLOTRDRAFT_97328, partial [Gloeophyllum trabeum ATCC 11539]
MSDSVNDSDAESTRSATPTASEYSSRWSSEQPSLVPDSSAPPSPTLSSETETRPSTPIARPDTRKGRERSLEAEAPPATVYDFEAFWPQPVSQTIGKPFEGPLIAGSEPVTELFGAGMDFATSTPPPPSPPPSGHQYAPSDSQVTDTPLKSNADSLDTKKVDQLQWALREELEDSWVDGGAAFVARVMEPKKGEKGFPDIPSDAKIMQFLRQCEHFKFEETSAPKAGVSAKSTRTRKTSLRSKRASSDAYGGSSGEPAAETPESPVLEKDLYKPFETIMNDILKFFGRSTRQAIATHGQQMPHSRDVHATELKTSPDICIIGHGPSITKVQRLPNKPVYTHVAAPIELKREKDAYEGKQPSLGEWQAEPHTNHKIQLAVYARECFVQQPNRRFVYGLLLTEKF